MLEECFNLIYKIRITSLNKKINTNNDTLERSKRILESSNGSLNHLRNESKRDISPTRSESSTASAINNKMMSSFNEQFYQNDDNNKSRDERLINILDRKMSSPIIKPTSNENMTIHPSVIATLQELKKELKEWWASAATSKRGDEDAREEFGE